MNRPTYRIGRHGYVQFLRAMVDQPRTVKALVEELGVGKTAAYRVVQGLHRLKVIHVAGWVAGHRTRYLPLYAFGARPDCPPPTTRPDGRPVKTPPSAPIGTPVAPELIAFVSVLRAMEEPVSVPEAAAATGLDPRRLRVLIQELVRQRLAFVALWMPRQHGGQPDAHYEFGIDRPSAARPKPDRRARNARYRARCKRNAAALIVKGGGAANRSVFTLSA